MPQPSSAIHLANLSKSFAGTEAVHNVTLRVDTGDIVGFVGPNGAGKSTTIGMMMGFIRPTKGSLTLLGNQNIVPQSSHSTHNRIGYAAGDGGLPNFLTGKQYIDFCAFRFGATVTKQSELQKVLQPQLNKRIGDLSRGNKQKIALFAAMQHNPELIILDEPTSGLDPLMQDVFLNLISLEAKRGATIFMSSHILSEVASICRRVLFMKQGRIVTDKLVKEIEHQAGTLVTVQASKEIRLGMIAHPITNVQIIKNEESLIFSYHGEIGVLLRWLGSKRILGASVTDHHLDDIFRDMYHDEAFERKDQIS